MSITIYKLTSHIDWESSGVGVTFSGGGTGGSIPIGGLNGTGFPNQVTYWLDGDTLAGDEGFIYEVDSAGIGILGVNYIEGIGDSSGANSVLYLHGDSLYLGNITGGCLLLAESDAVNVVYYDAVTGKLSYGEVGAGGDILPFQSIGFADPLEIDAITYKDWICNEISDDTTININNTSDGDAGMIEYIQDSVGHDVEMGTMFTKKMGPINLDNSAGADNVISWRMVGSDIVYTIGVIV